MDYSIRKAEEAFDDMKNRIFQSVLEEIQEGAKIYDEANKNDNVLLTVINRSSAANIIAINEAKQALDLNSPESFNQLKELLVKQSIYDSIKSNLEEDVKHK